MSKDKGQNLNDCINALLKAITDMSFDVYLDQWELKYHIDVGILVKIPWCGIPNLPIFGDWLQDATDMGWVVRTIDKIGNSKDYMVVFNLAEEI